MTATRVRLARARLVNYEWSYSPRSEFDHTGTLCFSKRGGCVGDKDADLWDAITPCLEAIEGKFTVRHAERLWAADMARKKKAALAAVKDKHHQADMWKKQIGLIDGRLRQIRAWWNDHTANGVPHAPMADGASDEGVPLGKKSVSWMLGEFSTLAARKAPISRALMEYEQQCRVAYAASPTVWDEDDRAFVEQAGGDVDMWNVLLEKFPAVVKHHVPVWAVVDCGRDATMYRVGDNRAEQAEGIWFATREALLSEHRDLFTRTGRLRRGAFTRWSGSSRLTASEWLEAIADNELSEYAAYANSSAVEVELEVLDLGATLRGISPGIVDVEELDKVLESHGLSDIAECFENADTDWCGPWYRTNHDNKFDVATMVKDALPSVGQDVEQYFHSTWMFGYADDPGVWHYFAFNEAVPPLEQLELPL